MSDSQDTVTTMIPPQTEVQTQCKRLQNSLSWTLISSCKSNPVLPLSAFSPHQRRTTLTSTQVPTAPTSAPTHRHPVVPRSPSGLFLVGSPGALLKLSLLLLFPQMLRSVLYFPESSLQEHSLSIPTASPRPRLPDWTTLPTRALPSTPALSANSLNH